jgi:hypothetical protein
MKLFKHEVRRIIVSFRSLKTLLHFGVLHKFALFFVVILQLPFLQKFTRTHFGPIPYFCGNLASHHLPEFIFIGSSLSFLKMEADEQLLHEIIALSSNEERERKMFMQDLNKFMLESGKPLSKIPIMGYKELDLFQLFKEVSSFGGFNEVL